MINEHKFYAYNTSKQIKEVCDDLLIEKLDRIANSMKKIELLDPSLVRFAINIKSDDIPEENVKIIDRLRKNLEDYEKVIAYKLISRFKSKESLYSLLESSEGVSKISTLGLTFTSHEIVKAIELLDEDN